MHNDWFNVLGGPVTRLTPRSRRYGRDSVPNELGTASGLAPIATAEAKKIDIPA